MSRRIVSFPMLVHRLGPRRPGEALGKSASSALSASAQLYGIQLLFLSGTQASQPAYPLGLIEAYIGIPFLVLL